MELLGIISGIVLVINLLMSVFYYMISSMTKDENDKLRWKIDATWHLVLAILLLGVMKVQ